MKLLFAVVAPIPRAVQYIISEAESSLQSSSDICFYDMDLFYRNAFDQLNSKYDDICELEVTPQHMHAILFRERIAIDGKITEMITKSFLINSLSIISKTSRVIPKTCLLSLKIYTDKNDNLKEMYWETIQDVIYKLDQIYFSNSAKIILGEFLEVAVKGIIETRLYALLELSNSEESKMKITIKDLLQITGNISCTFNCAIEKLLRKSFIVPELNNRLKQFVLSNSYKHVKKFLSQANSTFSIDDEILTLSPDTKECFDYGLMFYTKGLRCSTPFAIFIDTKSGNPAGTGANNTHLTKTQSVFTINDLPKNGKQALHLMDIANRSTQMKEVNNRSLLEALRRGSYLYIYVNSTIGAPSYAVNDHVIQLGERDTKSLLSFFADSYRLVRVAAFNQK